jgi:ethanolamine transporter EutH
MQTSSNASGSSAYSRLEADGNDLITPPPPAEAMGGFVSVAMGGFFLNINGGYMNAAVWLTHVVKTTHMTGATTVTSANLALGLTNARHMQLFGLGLVQIM